MIQYNNTTTTISYTLTIIKLASSFDNCNNSTRSLVLLLHTNTTRQTRCISAIIALAGSCYYCTNTTRKLVVLV